MATAKRDFTDPRVQGPRVVDLRDDVVSVDEVSRRLDIPKTTLYGWRHKGKGPRSHRVGKHLRYRWSDVLEWLDAQD
ncbi:MAG: helix-turn-helix domain-containing protein [Actinobacteria bacterium]|nr:helix-turn-helix domain-containing protein [Actinomycetota bacterium]